MTIFPLLLLVLIQTPTPAVAHQQGPEAGPAASRADRVELTGGEVLEGRILIERAGYLEIELEPGAVVGFRTSQVQRIVRGGGAELPAVAAVPLPPKDEWFRLVDTTGTDVGWLHATVHAGAGGNVVLQEEWEFEAAGRQFQVTHMETADHELRPLSCYFRERVREAMVGASPLDPMAHVQRTRSERIVEATVAGEQLAVVRLCGDGRSQRSLAFGAGATFPLLAREQQARRAPASDGDVTEVTVFEAAVEELQVCRFTGARERRIKQGDGAVAVLETVEESQQVRNSVWRDEAHRVIRREIAGPTLVALPSDADGAQRGARAAAAPHAETAEATAARTSEAAFVAEQEQRFGLWRPNPVWTVTARTAGSIVLCSELHRACIALSALQLLDRDAVLDTAVDTAVRWFLLLRPGLVEDRRAFVRVRDRQAGRIEFVGGRPGARERTVLHVIAATSGWLILECTAPESSWNELAADFEAAAARLELVPAVVATLLPKDPPPAIAATNAPSSETAPAAPAPQAPVRVRLPATEPPALAPRR